MPKKAKKELPKVIDAVVLKENIDYFADYHRLPRTLMYSVAEQESPWKLFKKVITDSTYKTDTAYVASKQIGKAKEKELGPFQIKPSTARLVWRDKTTPLKVLKWKLLHNIAYNTETAAILLEGDYDFYSRKYKNVDKIWKYTLTAFNLGRYKTNHIPKPSKYGMAVFNRWVTKFGKAM